MGEKQLYSEPVIAKEIINKYKCRRLFNEEKDIRGEYGDKLNNNVLRKEIEHVLEAKGVMHDLKNNAEKVLSLTKDYCYSEEPYIIPPDEIALNNCTLKFDLVTGEKEVLPKGFSLNRFFFDYDSSVKLSEDSRYYYWLREDYEPEDATRLEMALAAGLLPHIRFDKTVFLIGEGSSGKSGSIKLLDEIWKTQNAASIELRKIEEDKYAISPLLNTLAGYDDDNSKKKIDGRLFKKISRISGNIRYENKYEPSKEFKPYCTLYICTNQMPKFDANDHSYADRMLIIPTKNVPIDRKPEPPDGFYTPFSKEAQAILIHLIDDVLPKLIRNNWKIPTSNQAEVVLNDYREEINSICAFENEVLVYDRRLSLSTSDGYRTYTKYCNENSLKIESKTAFRAYLRMQIPKKGIIESHAAGAGGTQNGFRGVGITNNEYLNYIKEI